MGCDRTVAGLCNHVMVSGQDGPCGNRKQAATAARGASRHEEKLAGARIFEVWAIWLRSGQLPLFMCSALTGLATMSVVAEGTTAPAENPSLRVVGLPLSVK